MSANPPKLTAREKLDRKLAHRKEKPEVYAEINKRYYQKHRAQLLANKQRYRENNKEKISESGKKYYAEHKDKWLLRYRPKYRAKKLIAVQSAALLGKPEAVTQPNPPQTLIAEERQKPPEKGRLSLLHYFYRDFR